MKKIFRLLIVTFVLMLGLLFVGCGKQKAPDNTHKNGVIDWSELDPDKDKNKEPNENQNPTDNPNENQNPTDNPNENQNDPPQGDPVDGDILEIKVTFDTAKYTATVEGSDVEASVSHDAQYTYEWFVVKALNGKKISNNVKLYVNGELKELKEAFDKYQTTFNEDNTELTYKIKDPNWTPTY